MGTEGTGGTCTRLLARARHRYKPLEKTMRAAQSVRRHRGLPTWRYGIGGALGVGRINGEHLKSTAFQLVLPATLLLWIDFGTVSILIFIGAIVVSVRLSRLEGDPDMVEFANTFWKWTF